MVLKCSVFVEIFKQFQSLPLPPPAMFVYMGDIQGDRWRHEILPGYSCYDVNTIASKNVHSCWSSTIYGNPSLADMHLNL